MSQWHRENPELCGTDADPGMLNEGYRQARSELMREGLIYAEASDDPIPWFTDQHAREAAERMKAYARTRSCQLGLVADVLSDAQWLNLARVAFELRPR